MKISKLFQLGSALVVSLSALLSLSVPMALAATSNCTWTDGSNSDNNFNTASNWSCSGTTPGNGDIYNLTFPGTAAGFGPFDNIASLNVGTITFSGNLPNGYDIQTSNSNNIINISGGITDSSSGSSNEIDVNLTLGASQQFSAGSGTQLVIGGGSDTVAVGTNTLTTANVFFGDRLTGSGALIIDDPSYPADVQGVDLDFQSPGFTGSVAVNNGALFVDDPAALSNASGVTVASGAFLKGNGAASAVTIQSGGTIAPGHSPGCITTASMTINGTYTEQIGGTNACTDYDQLQITGNVDVTGGTLQTQLINGFTPTVGQTFKIIDNQGSNPLTGTFAGLAEGATFVNGGITFRISYVGGDGNDVTLTVIPVATGSGSSGGGAAPKSPNTGLAAMHANPWETFLLTSVLAGGLVGLGRRLKPSKD